MLGKEVSVVCATKPKTSDIFEWGLKKDIRNDSIIYLFEIPDFEDLNENFRILRNRIYNLKTSKNITQEQEKELEELKQKLHYYVPCNIKGRIKTKKSQFCTYRDFTGPFLVELSDLRQNISQKCSYRIKDLWETSKETLKDKKFAITPEKQDIKDCLRLSDKDFDGKPIKISINGAGTLHEDQNNPFLITNSLSIEINKDYTLDENFSYEVLSLHYNYNANRTFSSERKDKIETPFSLKDSLSLFFQNEELDEKNEWYCPHCSKFVCPTKKTDIWSCPEFLILHFKRFITEGSSSRKNDQLVQYPLTINLKDYVVGPLIEDDARYQLYAVILHTGNINAGHYRAICKSPISNDNSWFLYNDSEVTPITQDQAISHPNAYLLFYERY